MIQVLECMHRFIWGVPALVLIVLTGINISIRTGFPQIRFFSKAFRAFVSQFRSGVKSTDGTSPFQALCTALAATVGTGNLVGVAGAIAIGGPGAIFWMWICAFLGMATKFAEATLAVRYREKNPQGEWLGGPMYMVVHGVGKRWKWLAGIYCFFGVVAAFGVGNATQINAVVSGVNGVVAAYGGVATRIGDILIGCFLAVLIVAILLGGAKRVGTVAERIVPFAAVFYMLLCVGVLSARVSYIMDAFTAIIKGAFAPKAVTGGMLGSAFQALRVGASRGAFTNEAGLGTASIAHSAANVRHPVEQGLMGIIEVFLDTIVICTMTALVILCSGVTIPYGTDVGATLTTAAFSSVYGKWVCVPITAAMCLFAIATVLGWGLYGARCAQFLFGETAWRPFVWLQAGAAIFGAVLKTGTVWTVTEIVNGLMVIPNLIVLAYLTPELARLTKEYINFFGRRNANGGTYENLNQCKSLRTVSYAEIPPACGER